MSSIDYHEDEWGRHFSYAPALHGTRFRQPYSLFAALVDGIAALGGAIAERMMARDYAQTLGRLSTGMRQDVLGVDEAAAIESDGMHLRDEFGRRIV